MSARILIVGRDAVTRTTLKRLLAPQAAAIAEAADVGEAVVEARLQQPHVVVMDGSHTKADEAVRALLMEIPETKALIVSNAGDPTSVRAAFAAGASGYVLGAEDESAVVAAVRTLINGDGYVEPELGARVIAAEARPPSVGVDPLTRRQRQVLRLLALGHTNQEIAQELALSVRTVETHRAQLMRKLQISSRAGLVRYAMERRLLTD